MTTFLDCDSPQNLTIAQQTQARSNLGITPKNIITAVEMTGDIVQIQVGSGTAGIMRITADAAGYAIGGVNPTGFVDGQTLIFLNVGFWPIRFLLLNRGTDSILGFGAEITIQSQQAITLLRDDLSSRWRVL